MAVQEGGKRDPTFVTFEEVEGIYESQILPAIEKHIKKGSKIITDGEGHYVGSTARGYSHDRYVESQYPELDHEGIQWANMLTSNLKRFLLSTHHAVHATGKYSFDPHPGLHQVRRQAGFLLALPGRF